MERVEDDLFNRPLRVFVAVDGAFDDISQFAHIAGPGIGLELGQRARREPRPVGPIQLDRHAAPEMLGEQRHVVLPRTQRRKRDHLERQAVEQVGAKLALVDLRRRFSLVAATMRTSTEMGLDAPMRVISPYSTARRSRS